MNAFSKWIAVSLLAVSFGTAASAQSYPVKPNQPNDKLMIGSNVEYAMGLGFGVNVFGNVPDGYDWMKDAWGLDFTFNFAEFYWSGLNTTNQFYLTLGLENKSFRLREDTGYGLLEKHLVPVPFGEDKMKMSALRVFSWNVGMGYRYEPGTDFALTVGPIVNFNTGSRIKTKYYDENDKKQKVKTKWGKQELVTIEAMLRIDYHGLGVYVKYNPFPLIQKDFGPEVTTWSVGIML